MARRHVVGHRDALGGRAGGRSPTGVAALATIPLLLLGLGSPGWAQESEAEPGSGVGDTAASDQGLCDPSTGDRSVVEGTVRDRTVGAPLPRSEVRIAVLPAPDHGSLLERTVSVNARGRYRFCDLPGGRSGRVTASFGGFMGAMQRVELVAGDTSVVDLRVSLGRAAYVLGWVRDAEAGKPVENAMIQVEPMGLTAFTNARGRFKLPRVPPGSHVLRVEHVAFAPQSAVVEIEPGAGLEVDVRLPVRAVAMEPLEVTVESRPRHLMQAGFFEREELGLGRYLTPEDVERRQPARLRHLLMGLPGVTLPPCRGVECSDVPRAYTGCTMSVWVDGVRIRGGLWWLRAQEVAAAEVYRGPAETPAEFHGTGCGAVVLWTKR